MADTRMTLMELAKRLEAATGPDRELGREVLRACGWTEFTRGYFLGPLVWWSPPKPTDGRGFDDDKFYDNDPTASLDAAMSLVPEGWSHGYNWNNRHSNAQAHCELIPEAPFNPVDLIMVASGKCATPALALCAASLRARAQ